MYYCTMSPFTLSAFFFPLSFATIYSSRLALARSIVGSSSSRQQWCSATSNAVLTPYVRSRQYAPFRNGRAVGPTLVQGVLLDRGPDQSQIFFCSATLAGAQETRYPQLVILDWRYGSPISKIGL